MSQVDFVNYIPLLFWSIIFLGCFYSLIFIYILPLFFASLKVRSFYYESLICEAINKHVLIELLWLILKNNSTRVFFLDNLALFTKIIFKNYFCKQVSKYKPLK
jgi:hypothetical protein